MVRIFVAFLFSLLWVEQGDAEILEKGVRRVSESEQGSFDSEARIAIVVGVDSYPELSGLSRLSFAAADAQRFGEVMTAQRYTLRLLTNETATRGIVRRTLKEVQQLVSPGRGTVVFFFSGHGFSKDSVNYLATYEAVIDDLESTGLSLEDLHALLKETGARRLAVFIDACRDMPGEGTKALGLRSFSRWQESEGLRMLFSTRAGEVSYEALDLQHGIFSHFLLEGLAGEAAQDDGFVTFQDLADYVEHAVKSWSFKRGKLQVPYDSGEASGDFLIARARRGSTLAGELWTSPGLPIEFSYIPPGVFRMGDGGPKVKREDERARRVDVNSPYWMSRTEVTQGQFEAFVAATGHESEAERAGWAWVWEDTGWTQLEGASWRDSGGDDYPVVHVSWDDAEAFCKWLSKKSGEKIRLPTEVEWEYAARAGADAPIYPEESARGGACDSSPLNETAWYCGNSNGRANPVGEKASNEWGLHDMIGNVWEWTEDSVTWSLSDSSVDSPPVGSIDIKRTGGPHRAVRGCSWRSHVESCRVTNRNAFIPTARDGYLGFRIVRTLE